MPRERSSNRSPCHCITMRRAATAITEFYDDAFQELGITTNQYSILINLYSLETATTSELAEKINLERSTLVRNLKPIMEKGWIEDLSSEGARNRALTVSEAGKALIKQAKPIWRETQRKIKEYLGEENTERLMELLYKLQDIG